MHIVVDDVAGGAEVDWVDYLVIAVFFVAVCVLRLTAVAWYGSLAQIVV